MRWPGPFIAALGALLALEGCGGRTPAAVSGVDDSAQTGEAGDYPTPPMPLAVETAHGQISLSGAAAPGAKVRLATPDGQAMFAGADGTGHWRLALGPLTAPQIYGLSATIKGRTAQAQGYLLVAPQGQAALLRAGGAAWRIDRPDGFGLRSLDFDREGGAAISVAAPIHATVIVRLDGRQIAEGRADAEGRYELAAPAPIRPGLHRLQVVGDGFADAVSVQITAPLAQGALHSQFTPAGLRADWVTPGGGVQSTLVIH